MTAGALEQTMTMTTTTTTTTMMMMMMTTMVQQVTAMLAGAALDLQMMAERERAARRVHSLKETSTLAFHNPHSYRDERRHVKGDE
jgi:hypothetical protein